MNPVYDNSVPFYPTIPNQNPINSFFPSQMQQNGPYSRDMYFQNAVYPNPAPLTIPFPPSFGYNSNRSMFFPSSSQRPIYSNLGIVNTGVAPIYTTNHHNLVNPAYYPNSSSGLSCTCGNHNPVLTNSNHVPAYNRLVPVGNLMYQLPNPNSQFNPANGNCWPNNQNPTYNAAANPVAGNSTNANWNYHPNLNQNQSSRSLPHVPANNYNAERHATCGNNRSWIPYSNQNTFRPIPNETNNDDLLDTSSDRIASPPPELNLAASRLLLQSLSPPFPVRAWRKDPAPNAARSPNYSLFECSFDGCLTDNSEQDNLEANAEPNLDRPGRSDVLEEPIPSTLNVTSLTDANVVNVDLVNLDNHGANSNQDGTDPVNLTCNVCQPSEIITSTPISSVNTAIIENGPETVRESNDLGLNQDPDRDIQNIVVDKASEKEKILDDNIPQAEKNSGNLQIAIESKSAEDVSSLGSEDITTTSSAILEIENRSPNATSVNPPSLISSPVNTTKESGPNPDRISCNTNADPTILETEVTNDTENSNCNCRREPELKLQSLDSNKPNHVRFSQGYPTDKIRLQSQVATNFRLLLIRYLNRLDNVNIPTDPDTSYANLTDDVVNSFVVNLNSESRRILLQTPNYIGMGHFRNVPQNVSNESQVNVDNSEKNEAGQTTDGREAENVRNESQEQVDNSEKNKGEQTLDTEIDQDSCANRKETSVNSTQSQPELNEYQSADDVDVVNTNLGTIEVTVGNNSVEEETIEVVPLDLVKEKNDSETQTDAKSRYFEVSEFLPTSGMYLEYVDPPKDTTVYTAYNNTNGVASHAVEVFVELKPLNHSSNNVPTSTESQTEDMPGEYPEPCLLVTSNGIESPLNTGATVTSNNEILVQSPKKPVCLVTNGRYVAKRSVDMSTEPPMKKICVTRRDNKIVLGILKTDKPNT